MYIYIIYRSYRYFFFHPIYYPRTTIAIPPSNTSYPGSQGGPSSPLPTSQLQSDWSLSCDHGLDYARTTTTTTTTSVRSFFLSREEFNIFFPRRLASRCTGVCRLHIKPSFLPNYIPNDISTTSVRAVSSFYRDTMVQFMWSTVAKQNKPNQSQLIKVKQVKS